ncbi:hypothetical protein GT037_009402 [Alternaria burnsii]|uniref:Uncharacterized protein n=1 Tax=Alternaria burnsii TaxID=1187904 RepID=A0A8H7AVI5_9PLEO|nr:uncharacterized protein GT037_009402 [Alternaria burnsii]KAF7672371.1 hypothetical protein GT037_009402 [Alternaria burnsii]
MRTCSLVPIAPVVEQESPPLQKSIQHDRFTTHYPHSFRPLVIIRSPRYAWGDLWQSGGAHHSWDRTIACVLTVEWLIEGVGIARTHPASNSLQRFTLA